MRVSHTTTAAGRGLGAPEWVWEVLLIVSVVPALVYGVLALAALPVA